MSRQKLRSSEWNSAGVLLRELMRRGRDEQQLSQEELARRTGLSLAALRKIERGATAEPGIFTVLAIWRALNIPIEQLSLLSPVRIEDD